MKKLLACILGISLVFGLTACGNKHALPYEKIDYECSEKGVLKTSIRTAFTSDDFSRRTDTFISENDQVSFEYEYEYDKKKKKWNFLRKTFYTYSSDGLLTLKKEENKWNDDPIFTDYNYNEYGLIISEYEVEDGEVTVTDYSYDLNNNLVCEITDGPRDYYKTTYEYDLNNNLICEMYYYSGNGGYSWASEGKLDFTYDKNNVLIKKERFYKYNGAWKKDSLNEYTYNEKKKISTVLTYKPSKDGQSWEEDYKTKYKYDENNNLIKESEYDRGDKLWSLQKWNESFKVKYKYDKDSRLISESEYDVSIWETKIYSKTEYYYTNYN